jgi:hypothetical protein
MDRDNGSAVDRPGERPHFPGLVGIANQYREPGSRWEGSDGPLLDFLGTGRPKCAFVGLVGWCRLTLP